MTDDDLPWITPNDITPAMRDLGAWIMRKVDRGELSMTLLERALVAYTRMLQESK